MPTVAPLRCSITIDMLPKF